MSRLYIATPHAAAGAITDVATGNNVTKTLLQVATPSTTPIVIFGWGVSFDGVVSNWSPVDAWLVDTDVAATVTSLTVDGFGNPADPASACVGGTSATGYNATVEGTIAASRVFDAQEVHPQTGYSVWFPSDARPRMAVSRFLRIRTLSASGDVNCHPWIVFDE